jgi:hypothetical protein
MRIQPQVDVQAIWIETQALHSRGDRLHQLGQEAVRHSLEVGHADSVVSGGLGNPDFDASIPSLW